MTSTTKESLDKTVHLLRMKHDPEYAALQADLEQAQKVLDRLEDNRRQAEKAKATDVQKAAFHSTTGVTHEDSAELQKMAAVLATMEIADSPEEKMRIMRGYLDGTL
ncbi:hypothetical protein [Pseudomonas sp. JUb52]|uniref:hypothetical protein n=1 Tax=Pseudomonas sp. JUb52 TaxID=2485127 RepID=UPI00104B8766|nr:hypothetical protein [Pseudomonas sp. JUb52]